MTRNQLRRPNRYTLGSALGLFSLVITCAACGGGGGGGGSSAAPGNAYEVSARVVSDTCNERLSDVQQLFTFQVGEVDTSLLEIPITESGGTIQGSYSIASGDCTRTFAVNFTDSGDGLYDATLKSSIKCPNAQCATEWQGTGAPVSSAKAFTQSEIEIVPRVRGENCNPSVPSTVGYRPSLFECNGNSSVLLAGNQRNNYSVVVRRNGQFNDRDPANPTCGTNRCSPYKTQFRLELPAYQANCLGGSGYSANYDAVNRISIKYTALIGNAGDPSQFEQYCLADPEASLNF